MSTPYPPTIEDRLNAAFVLSAALYFKSIRIETGENAAASLSLAGDLHTIARDLAALSECPTDALIEAKQMPRGLGDLLQSLEELIGLAQDFDQNAVRGAIPGSSMRSCAKHARQGSAA
ncbi:MAG: hypothetical protein AAFR10_20525, partial [Pseudomonadota bacterium]